MKKLATIIAVMLIATAAMAQNATSGLSADENFKKGGEAWKAENYKEAFFYLEKASKQGHERAQFVLGVLYKNGQGVERSMQKCAEWWEKSAAKGVVEAQGRLAFCYYEGEGVQKDVKKAAYWWQKAADQGDAEAQCMLAICYYEGTGVTKDLKKAEELLRKAASQGQEQAKELLKQLRF